MINQYTIDFLESAEKTLKSRFMNYHIGKNASRDKKIKEKNEIISKDLNYILQIIKDGQI